jgi:hypothetical protein
MRSVAKKTLPHYNPNLPPARKRKNLPLGLVRDLSTVLKISSALVFKNPITQLLLQQIETLRKKYEVKPTTLQEQIKATKKAINKKIKIINQEQIAAACAKKEATFALKIKKNISAIFDKGYLPPIDFWKTPQGEIITDPEAFLAYAHDHYQNHLFRDRHKNGPPLINTMPARWRQEYAPKGGIQSYWYDELKAPISMMTMEQIIGHLPNKKAPGPTQVSNEMIKNLGPHTKVILLAILNCMIRTNKIPRVLLKNLMILLPKEKEFSGLIKKTRPIALQETIKKIVSIHITRTLTAIIEKHDILKGFNSGFTPNQSTKDIIFTIKNVIDVANQTKHPLFIASLDIEGAYDTVKRQSLQLALQRIRVPNRTIELIVNLELERQITLITSKGDTDPIIPEQHYLKARL